METILLLTVCAAFAAGLLWWMLAAKRSEPITTDEARMLWKIHRKDAHCSGQRWEPIKRKDDRIEGFFCECGYHYLQKRPVLVGTHKTSR